MTNATLLLFHEAALTTLLASCTLSLLPISKIFFCLRVSLLMTHSLIDFLHIEQLALRKFTRFLARALCFGLGGLGGSFSLLGFLRFLIEALVCFGIGKIRCALVASTRKRGKINL